MKRCWGCAALFLGGDFLDLFLLHSRGTFAKAAAEVGELGAADITPAIDLHFVHARRVDRENALDGLAVADAADGEGRVQAVATAADDDAGEDLDALLVALDRKSVV